MRKTTYAFTLFSLTLLLAGSSCGKDDSGVDYAANADCSATVSSDNTYNLEIKDILNTNCATAGCHDAVTATEGVDLSDYAKAKNAFEKKPVLCAIHHGSGCKPMPNTGGQLSNSDINKIDCWVKSGYLQ